MVIKARQAVLKRLLKEQPTAIPTWSLVFSCTFSWLPFFTMSSHWLMTMLSFVLIDSLITFNWFPMFSHLINRLTPKSNQRETSPSNIHTLFSKQLMRLQTFQVEASILLQYHVLITNLQGNVQQLEGRINDQNLGIKCLKTALKVHQGSRFGCPACY